MALGLLPGYEYAHLSVGSRRVKFLRESDWLRINQKSKIKDFDSASKNNQDDALDSLRNTEKYWIEKIADEFVKEVKLKDEDGKEIKDALGQYVKLLDNHMDKVQDAAGNIIDYVPKTTVLFPPDIEDDAPSADESTDREETTNQGISKKDPKPYKSDADPPPSEPKVPPSPPSKTTEKRTSRNINRSVTINVEGWIPFLICVTALAIVGFIYMCFVHFGNTPSSENESLVPGEIYQSKYSTTTNYYLILTGETAVESIIEYTSSDPGLIEVSENGFLFVHEGQPGEISRDVEITTKDANGVIGIETFTVDFTKGNYDSPVDNINDFVPSYTLTQQVRLVGSSTWSNTVDAKVGDKVEFWIQYQNTSDKNQMNVMIRDILPQSLRYIDGTTKLWSADYDGFVHNENTITTTGFNIGHYAPEANAHVRFQAEVVADDLACGGNVLGKWAQATAAGINMQNATVVNVNKNE